MFFELYPNPAGLGALVDLGRMEAAGQTLGKPFVIAIAGGSGSGKTLLAQSLMSVLPPRASAFLSQDSYYRSLPAEFSRCPEEYNFDHPDALEWELLARHVEGLRRRQKVEIPRYCFLTHRRTGSDQLEPASFLILEGTLILHDPRLVSLADLRVFLDVDADTRLLRRIVRDTRERGRSLESVLEQYVRTVRPMYHRFVVPTREKAHLVLTDATIEEWTRAVMERIKLSESVA